MISTDGMPEPRLVRRIIRATMAAAQYSRLPVGPGAGGRSCAVKSETRGQRTSARPHQRRHGRGGTSMIQVMCRIGLALFTMLASITGQITSAMAQSNSSLERFEVSAVKAARPFLVDTI